MVLAKLSTGDLRFQSAGMPRDIILNPASLEPSIPDEPRQIYVPPETNRNEETGQFKCNNLSVCITRNVIPTVISRKCNTNRNHP